MLWTGRLGCLVVALVLVGALVALHPVYADGHPLIKKIYVEGMNPDGTLYLGIQYTMEVGAVPGADLGLVVRPLKNTTYTYRYSVYQGEIRFAVYGEPGEYNVTVTASLGGVSDSYTMVIDFVSFNPEFNVTLVNTEYPMSDAPALLFMVRYLGNGGSTDRYTPVDIYPYINDYVGGVKAEIRPTHIVFGGDVTEALVNMTLKIPATYYPGTMQVGLVLKSYGMLIGVYRYGMDTGELKQYFSMKPVEIRIHAPGYTVSFEMRVARQVYRANGTLVRLPVVFPVKTPILVSLNITGPSGKNVYTYTARLTYREYAEELAHWLRARDRTLYFKTDNSTSDLYGVYRIVYPNGTAVETAYLSKIFGLPSAPLEKPALVPGAVLYAKGVAPEITVPRTNNTVARGGGGGFLAGVFALLFIIAIIVAVAVVVIKRRRGVPGAGKEGGEAGEEAVEVSTEQLDSILNQILEREEEEEQG